MAAFSLGVIAVGFFSTLPALSSLLMIALLPVAVLLVGLKTINHGYAKLCFPGFCFLLGMLWHVVHAQQQLDRRLPFEFEGVDVVVSGTVVSLPEQRGALQQFMFEIDPGSRSQGFNVSRVLLNYYGPNKIEPAQHWQFTIRLKRPHGFANPGTFDYESWLWQQGVGAKGYVRDAQTNVPLVRSEAKFAPKHSLLKLRSFLRERVLVATQPAQYQSIIVALTLGDRTLLTDRQWALFSSTGTNHLVVVSGLHVGFFAGVCYLIVSFGWRLNYRLMLCIPAQKAGASAAIAGALFYALLAGFSLPAQRALVMVAVFMLAKLFSIRLSAAFSFLAALVLVLLIDPFASVSVGFWLSFVAVAGLLLVFAAEPVVAKTPWFKRLWRNWGRAQLVVFVALAAPLVAYVGELALWSPLVNAFAIPLVSWVTVPLCMLALALVSVCPGAATIFYFLVDGSLGVLISGLEWFAFNSLFPANWHSQSVNTSMLLFTALASFVFLIPLNLGYRVIGCLLMLPLMFPQKKSLQADEFQLIVLDVGQGLATIVRTADRVLVYDTGAGFEEGFNSGSQILRPVLSHLGVSKVDTLVISHADNDHAGGAQALVESIRVDRILGGDIELSPNLVVEACTVAESWQWDGVEFRFLHPENSSGWSFASRNNQSCVLQIVSGKFSLLLPGDIEANVENQLASRYGARLRSQVLVAAHHGSNTSSSSRFIAAVRPGIVVFSAGYRSQFGHPTEKVQRRFTELGSQLLNTAETGMISFTFSGQSGPNSEPIIEIYRKQRAKYWN